MPTAAEVEMLVRLDLEDVLGDEICQAHKADHEKLGLTEGLFAVDASLATGGRTISLGLHLVHV